MAHFLIPMIIANLFSVSEASKVPILSTSELLKGISEISQFVMFYMEEQEITFGNSGGGFVAISKERFVSGELICNQNIEQVTININKKNIYYLGY